MLPNLSKLPLCNSTGYRAGVPVPNIWKPRRGLRGEAASLRAEAASLREEELKSALRKALESLKECKTSDGLNTQIADETARVVQLERALGVGTLLRSVESDLSSLETDFNTLPDGEKDDRLQGVADEVLALERKASGIPYLEEKTRDVIDSYKLKIEKMRNEIGYVPFVQPDYVPFTPPAGNGG